VVCENRESLQEIHWNNMGYILQVGGEGWLSAVQNQLVIEVADVKPKSKSPEFGCDSRWHFSQM
jgi:hypothetical protein